MALREAPAFNTETDDYDLLVENDALGLTDAHEVLGEDPHRWKDALTSLLDDVRSELATLNAEIKGYKVRRPSGGRTAVAELQEKRAKLIDEQAQYDTRLREVKALLYVPPKRQPEAVDQVKKLLRDALTILDRIESTDGPDDV